MERPIEIMKSGRTFLSKTGKLLKLAIQKSFELISAGIGELKKRRTQ